MIAGYDAWGRPGEFHDYVARAEALTDADRALFEAAWTEAMDTKHWRSADLAACAGFAEDGLRQRFPTLSAKAIWAIANAAAYLWR